MQLKSLQNKRIFSHGCTWRELRPQPNSGNEEGVFSARNSSSPAHIFTGRVTEEDEKFADEDIFRHGFA